MMDFEYAIKKDVRNNPIVREIDHARHRELWRSVAVGVFLMLVLLFSAFQHFEQLRYGYQLEQLQQQRAADAGRLPSKQWQAVIGRRVLGAAIVFMLWTVAIEARLVYLQVVQHDELVSRAERQQMRTVTAPAKRGDIVDRRGNVLAYSVDA